MAQSLIRQADHGTGSCPPASSGLVVPGLRDAADRLAETARDALRRQDGPRHPAEIMTMRQALLGRLSALVEAAASADPEAAAAARGRAEAPHAPGVAEAGAVPLSHAAGVLRSRIAEGDAGAVRSGLGGIDLNLPQDTRGGTPLHWALIARDRNPDVVDSLLEAGARVDLPDEQGLTPLHLVAAAPHPDRDAAVTTAIVGQLMAAGADIEATDSFGWTPLHRAVLAGTAMELSALLAHGADPNVPFGAESVPHETSGRLPLMAAAHKPGKVRLLLDYGADPLGTDAAGVTVVSFFAAVERYTAELIGRRTAQGLADRLDRELSATLNLTAGMVRTAAAARQPG